MAMAMKISPSVRAATLTWCAMPQLTSGRADGEKGDDDSGDVPRGPRPAGTT
jgi:hypothetical protein